MGAFAQLASNIKGFACKFACHANVLTCEWGLGDFLGKKKNMKRKVKIYCPQNEMLPQTIGKKLLRR